jgi:hypothetical protein
MKSLVDGYVPTDICEACILAKHERKIIRVPVLRTTTPFELGHSDTYGPFTTKLHGGLHFIIFIDAYTRHTTACILLDKRAESCISAFQSFKARIESWGYTIKRFRCDNGRGEYDNTLFRRILAGSGVSFEPSPPYTQHKNGVAERMIGTLTEKARAMMLESLASCMAGLPAHAEGTPRNQAEGGKKGNGAAPPAHRANGTFFFFFLFIHTRMKPI